MNQTVIQADASTLLTQASDCGVFKLDGAYTSGTTITIQDMTIQNGYNSFSGGGIRLVNTGTQANAPTINLTNLKISANRGSYGGGIYIQGAALLTINGCNITGNSQTTTTTNIGGGIGVTPGTGNLATVTIKNSTISGNSSVGNGGGIAITCGGNGANTSAVNSLWIENSTIYGNSINTSAKIGAGIYYKTCGTTGNSAHTNNLTLNHCTIVSNTTNAGTGGDGVCIDNSGGYATSVVMNNSIVIGNSGSTSNASQIGVNHLSISGNGKITNTGITNSIFGIISGGTWATTTTHNNLSAVVGDLAFAANLSTDATPVLKFGESSIARNYLASNLLLPGLTTDQLGNERVGYTDAGAYEFPNYIISGTTNAADIVCTTCDVTVASGGELTVGATKTLKSVTVTPGAKLTVNDGVSLIATNGITLQNTASATASFVDSRAVDSPTAIVGTVEQAITETNRNWYVAVPVTGKLASDITLSGAKIVQRNEALSRWDDVLSGAGLTAGVGYIAVASASSGTTSWSLNGNLNSGKVEVPVTRSGASSIGFNLLGNPYPSYLNWEQVLSLNATNASLLQSSIWYRTKSGASYAFQTYNSAGRVATPTSTTGYIPPMQAFWVRANAAGTVTFTNAMRSHGDGASNKLKAPKVNTQQIIRLQVSNAAVTDEAVVYIDQNAQNTFDKYDTEKMFNNVVSQPELYTKAGTEKLVINGLNEINDNQEIPLGLTYTQGGDLKLKLTELNNFDSNTKVYLRDKQLCTETELTPEMEYTFNTAAITSNESRFSLVYKVVGVSTGTTTPSNNRVSVFVNAANHITIIAPVKSNYAIYNAVGQLIENGILNSELQTTNCKLQTGVFVVKVNNQSTRVVAP
jgi:hypothetical protein